MRALRQTVRDFQNKVRKCMMIELAASSFQKAKSDKRKLSFIIGTLKQYSRKLLQQTVLSEEQEIKKRKEKQVWAYFMRFLTACRLSESALIRNYYFSQLSSFWQRNCFTRSFTYLSDISTSTWRSRLWTLWDTWQFMKCFSPSVWLQQYFCRERSVHIWLSSSVTMV